MFNSVLFPVDQSRESREAAVVVVDIVKRYGARLMLLSVIPETESDTPAQSPDVMASPEAVTQLLEDARRLFTEQGIDNVKTMTRQGIPPFVICDVADEIEADLIIMGCRGIGLTEEGAAESVTNRVINLSPCPVLIVP